MTDPAYTDVGLVDGDLRYYRVSAIGVEGESLDSAVLVAVPKDAGLTGPFAEPTAFDGRRDATMYGATPNQPDNDDGARINDAIRAAEGAGGGEVYLPAGVYHVGTTIRLASNVTLRGDSPTSTILRARYPDGGHVIVSIPGDSHDVILSSFRIDRDVPSADDVIAKGVQVGSSAFGTATERVLIERLAIEGFAERAIDIRRAHHVHVVDNLIRNATDTTVGGHGYGIVLNYTTNHDNWVQGNRIGPGIRHGVLVQFYAHHNLIEDNTCAGATEDAYDLHGEKEYSNELRGNRAFASSASGFGVGNTGEKHANSGPANWIHHNQVWNSESGINLIKQSERQYVEDNDFRDNTRDGITFHTGGADRVILLRNRATGNLRHGLHAEASRALHLEDNVVTGNAFNGIHLAELGCDGFEILENDLRNNAQGAKALGSSTGRYLGNLE